MIHFDLPDYARRAESICPGRQISATTVDQLCREVISIREQMAGTGERINERRQWMSSWNVQRLDPSLDAVGRAALERDLCEARELQAVDMGLNNRLSDKLSEGVVMLAALRQKLCDWHSSLSGVGYPNHAQLAVVSAGAGVVRGFLNNIDAALAYRTPEETQGILRAAELSRQKRPPLEADALARAEPMFKQAVLDVHARVLPLASAPHLQYPESQQET
ncbi:MAG: hypothetical protein ACKVPX_11675 [Myxococcaceae bacterium]